MVIEGEEQLNKGVLSGNCILMQSCKLQFHLFVCNPMFFCLQLDSSFLQSLSTARGKMA